MVVISDEEDLSTVREDSSSDEEVRIVNIKGYVYLNFRFSLPYGHIKLYYTQNSELLFLVDALCTREATVAEY